MEIIMLLVVHFAFQVILLGIGFGVGYWLLITANQHEGALKRIGQALGSILIGIALFFAIFGCCYSMWIANRMFINSGCPVQRFMEQEESAPNGEFQKDEARPLIENEQNDEREESEDSSGTERRTMRLNRSKHA